MKNNNIETPPSILKYTIGSSNNKKYAVLTSYNNLIVAAPIINYEDLTQYDIIEDMYGMKRLDTYQITYYEHKKLPIDYDDIKVFIATEDVYVFEEYDNKNIKLKLNF